MPRAKQILPRAIGSPAVYTLLTYLLTFSVEQSPSWEANWFCS